MIGVDVETTSLAPEDGRLRLVQLSDGKRAKVYDAFQQDPDVIRSAIDRQENLVAHNATFERTWLNAALELDRPDLHDTMVMSQVLYTGTDAAGDPKFSHSLAAVVSRELKVELDKEEQTSDWAAMALTKEQVEYAALDAAVLPKLAETLMKKIDKAGLCKVYELERRLSYAVNQMERNGFGIDEDRLSTFIEQTTEEANRLKAELEEEWGINPNSNKDLIEYFKLKERDGWPQTRGGAPSASQESLKTLIPEYPEIQKWVNWKKVEKRRSTYGISLQKRIVNGRIHARFKPFGAATGRFSSSTPNLQNIPAVKSIRSMFCAPEGRMLITSDYASIEIWVAALLWREERMKNILKQEGLSIHKATASTLLGKPMAEITDEEKQVGKTTNFALLYGAKSNRLYEQLNEDMRKYGVQVTEREAEDHFFKFLRTYKAFNQKRKSMREAFNTGRLREARTAMGRRRTDTTVWHGPYMNHEIQGTAADGLKYAIVRFHESGLYPDAKLVAVVHDEMVVEADEREVDEVKDFVERCMVEGMLDAVEQFRDEIPSLPRVESKVSRVWSK